MILRPAILVRQPGRWFVFWWSLVLWIQVLDLTWMVEGRRRLPKEVDVVVGEGWNNATSNLGSNSSRHLFGPTVEVPKATSPDDHLVTSLPLLDPSKFTTKHWAGLLPASNEGDKYLFYWLFAPDDSSDPNGSNSRNDEDIPLIIWLNGGPACSSMDGLWLENGPFRLVQSSSTSLWSIEIDPYSWHMTPAYVLYIDQPVGTGIAFTTSAKYPTNDREVNIDFYYFLQEFFALHADKFLDPDTKSTMIRPLYFSGESHAGHYIPSMMNYIFKQNIQEPKPKIIIPLSGAAIGNGWIDPRYQYSAHEAAYGYGIIGRAEMRNLAEKEKLCQQDLASGKYVSSHCFDLLDNVVDNSFGKGASYVVSQYDQRVWEKKGESREFPLGHKNVEAYLGGRGGSLPSDFRQVLEAIHSTSSLNSGQRYAECTDPPYNALRHQDGLGVTQDVVDLLNNHVQMLFFNGIHDLICNHVGNEITVEALEWDHQKDFQLSKRYGWKSRSKNQLAGYMRQYENLMYLKVLDSGHMVPMDVPEVSLDMMRSLVYGESFDNYEQGLERSEIKAKDGSQCPVCPEPEIPAPIDCPDCVCPVPNEQDPLVNSGDHNDDNQPANDSKAPTGTTITVPFIPVEVMIISSLAAVVLFGCICWTCGCCRRSKKIRGAMPVPTYDVELSNRAYTDRPEEYGEIS